MKASAIVRNLTVVLAVASMLSGIFIVELLALSKVQVPRVVMLQWALILGMPLLLLVSFLSFNRQPAKNAASVVLQSLGQLALFLIPYFWVSTHGRW
jgi:hypothetical protein